MNAGNHLTYQDPWPGLPSYNEEDAQFFHGRDAEAEQLFRYVQRNVLTIVFGPSGAGKTSLVQAGLFPKVRTGNFNACRTRLNHVGDLVKQVQTVMGLTGTTLWEGFHRLQETTTATTVLVLDQFEELFTLGEGRLESAGFLEQLADLVENYIPASARQLLEGGEPLHFDYDRQNYRIVLVMREEYVSRLDGLRKRMPSVMRGRLTIEPFNEKQALDAVIIPGKDVVDADVAREIVAFASSKARGPRLVDPSILSLLCRELNRRRSGEMISRDQLEGDSETILSEFWERSMDALGEVPPYPVRQFIENRLVTPDRFRTAAARNELAQYDATVEKLIAGRLLRAEERFGTPHLELTHDVLVPVVSKSRIERERREGAQRLAKTRRRLGVVVLVAVGCFVLAAGSLIMWKQAVTQKHLAEEQKVAADRSQKQLEELYKKLADSESVKAQLQRERDELQKSETARLVQLAKSKDEGLRILVETPPGETPSPPPERSAASPTCESLVQSGFRRDSTLLSDEDTRDIAASLKIELPVLLAVLKVEGAPAGFLPDGRPVILFERHIFHRLTGGKFDDDAGISAAQPGGYGPGGAAQYDRLLRAANLDCGAALQATTWGMAQIMGQMYATLGYPSVSDFVNSQLVSERNQVLALGRFLQNAGLLPALQSKDWTSFARRYNGPGFAANHYDERLRQSYEEFAKGALPDSTLRAVQLQLSSLGFNPGQIDGFNAAKTKQAIIEFQLQKGLPADGVLGARTKAMLLDNKTKQ